MNGISMTEKILSYIETHSDQKLTLEAIAAELNYSKFYMARIFKENTGVTVSKYIQGRRLEEAAGKLAQTARPAVEIALEAGYGSQQAFTRAFHRKYGCTPQEYRRNSHVIINISRRMTMDFSGSRESRAAA